MISPLSSNSNPNPFFSISHAHYHSTMSSSSSLFLLRHNAPPFFASPTFFLTSQRPKTLSLRLSASVADRNLHLSWSSPEHITNDYGGWAVVEQPVQKQQKKVPTLLIVGIGTWVAVLVAAIAHFSLSSKGSKFRFGNPLHSLHGILNTNESEVIQIADSGRFDESSTASDSRADAISDSLTSDKLELVIIPSAVDTTQQEALTVLKKLKIVEDDVKGGELCTRREYARWLVRINSSLERNPKHKIVSTISLSGSIVCAFDDVSVGDPDFDSIQALAEAGLIPSKLSWENSSSNGLRDNGDICFFPERFISRQDMINWKTQLEYGFIPGILSQISRTKVAFMDVKDISSDASPELFMDMMAGDKSILRKVFGQIKRFQPKLPSTKAQAAVGLISGRMMEASSSGLSKREAESYSRQAEMEEIKTELLGRGVIQRFWYEKLDEEKARGVEVEKVYLAALQELEEEKVVQEKFFAEHLKEKSAMDCQRQLLSGLKEEVDEMSERVACETTIYVADQRYLRGMLSDVQTKLEELLDTKSVLGAEKEAIGILRTWVEEEARKSQARAKVLEEVGQRWQWDDQTGTP